jgi:NAD dependent epimerase/dehydratase
MVLNNKKVLVTGADGFIGSHLVEALLRKGCEVRAFVLYNSFNSWGWIDTFPQETIDRIEIFPGDIRDPNGAKSAADGIDIIFHLAALISIPFSYHSPDCFVDTNVKGTLNILQAALGAKVEKILVTSTSEVYGTAQYVPIDEKHPLQGQSPYSASKIGADKIAESFYCSFNLPVVIVRPFNTYGPRQSARAIIPNTITQLVNGKEHVELGDISPTRDFLFIRDTIEGFIAIAESDNTNGETINIATQKEVTIAELTNKLIAMINQKAKIVQKKERFRPERSEVMRLLGSNKKIKKVTGWSPKYSLDKGLKETIEWYRNKENLKLYKHHIYNY